MKLREWKYMNSSGSIQQASSSQPQATQPATANYPSQEDRYKKLLAQIDSDGIAKYTVNLLDDRILDISVDTKYKTVVGVKIIFKPYVPCYVLMVKNKELNDLTYELTYEEVLEVLRTTGIIKNTNFHEALNTVKDLRRIPEKLYHATYLPFLDSIKADGLGKTENKMWTDSKSGVVYLADDPWVAESYAETSEYLEDKENVNDFLDNIIILEVDTKKLDLALLKIDENVFLYDDEENATWEYHGIIPWEACKIFNSSVAEDFRLYANLWD